VSGHGSVTLLVCLSAFAEAQRELERARSRAAEAALVLAKCRHKLDQVVDHAFRQQKFSPIEALFCEEEAARRAYKWAAKRLVRSKGRWFAASRVGLRARAGAVGASAELSTQLIGDWPSGALGRAVILSECPAGAHGLRWSMMSEIDETAALALADRHIGEGEERIRHLTMTRNSLTAAGRDTAEIDRLLTLLRDNLSVWHAHRINILRALEWQDRHEFNAAHEQVEVS